jgi:DNA-binding NarL/FixJ family response regulator
MVLALALGLAAQLEVWVWWVESEQKGGSNPEIAEELVVTPATVKTHVAHILMKLGVRDRVQAVILLYESGVIEPGRS